MTARVRPLRLTTVFLLALAGAATLLAQKPAAPGPPPKLAVVISVDGLSESRLMAFRPWYVAGLKRLLDAGEVETHAFYRHLNTETGPGHASLGTGALPRVHGIVINSWYEERPGPAQVLVYCTDQPSPFARLGPARPVPGPANLRIPTLGDRLVAQRPGARVVSVSGKDRAAIYLAGRNPAHAVYWYDRATGRFTTSPAYDVTGPDGAAAARIVERFNREQGGEVLRARIGPLWRKLPSPAPNPEKPLPSPVPPDRLRLFQIPSFGLGWEKDLTGYLSWSRSEPSGYFAGIFRSPLIDELTADLALAFLSDESLALGRREAPDLLAVSFSGHDPVAHDYGDESEETLDVLRRLDLQIGRLLDALERGRPPGSLLVAFSSDHGFTAIPEVARARDRAAGGGRVVGSRTYTDNIVDRLNRMLADELCVSRSARPVLDIEGWDLFYRQAAFPMTSVEGPCGAAGRAVTAADVDRVLPKLVRLGYDEEISDVLLVSQRSTWPKDSPVTGFVENDFDAARSGNAILIPRPGVITFPDPGRGAMHGSHHEPDTHVPLIFLGGPAVARSVDAPATPYDLAPTVGAWLGVTLPDATGRAIPLGK